jgi:hypothetical protein
MSAKDGNNNRSVEGCSLLLEQHRLGEVHVSSLVAVNAIPAKLSCKGI